MDEYDKRSNQGWRVGVIEGSDGDDDGGGAHRFPGVPLPADYPNCTSLCR